MTERLRVLALMDMIGTEGGAERLATEISMRLDRDRFEPHICVSRWTPDQGEDDAGAEVEAIREAGIGFIALERSSAADLSAWRPLVAFMRGSPVHILHAHKHGSNVWGSVLSRVAGTPVFVAHEHTWSFEGQPVRRFLDRELIGRTADAFIAVSREDRRRMIEVERVDPGKIRFIPNGIAQPEPGERGNVRAELGIDRDDPVIGAVCGFRPQKALDVIVRAMPQVLRELPRATLLLAGDGPEYARLEALVAELDLGRSVRLLGHRSDVAALLDALDVAVSSSDYEGSPLAIMEYMEAAKPVVATKVGGVPDLIEEGVHGHLVEPRDPQALATAIVAVLADPEAARRMGERARERRRAEFAIEVMVGRIAGLYEELWAARGG